MDSCYAVQRSSGGKSNTHTVDKLYFVYILSSSYGTLYTGVTSDLVRRLNEHKHGVGGAFTRKYRIHRLIYWEATSSILEALAREREIKGWRRSRKLDLIRVMNPSFRDLSKDFTEPSMSF